MKVGVTGASGQVGSRLLRHLSENGIPAVGAVRNPLGAALCDAVAPGSTIRIGSLTPPPGEPHLLDDCDVIINCAIASSGGIPRHAYTRNTSLVDGLLNAKSLRWLIHFSTVAVYGELIAADTTTPRPSSEYGRSKLHVERHAVRRARDQKIDCSVIRLGHVYGDGIARSREIIELSRDAAFRLPFDGRLPSNAIHVDAVGAAIVGLLTGGTRGAVYSLAEASNSWRDVFDWHTSCLGFAPVSRMPDQDSAAHRAALTPSLTRETLAWAKGLPLKSLVRSPAMFDLALQTLVHTPDAVTRRLSDVNRRTGARSHIARADAAGALSVPALYFSAGMPGPFLPLPPLPEHGLGAGVSRASDLREWYDRWRAPRLGAATAALHGDSRQTPEQRPWM